MFSELSGHGVATTRLSDSDVISYFPKIKKSLLEFLHFKQKKAFPEYNAIITEGLK